MKKIYFLLIIIFVVFPVISIGQGYTLLEELPGIGKVFIPDQSGTGLSDLLNKIFNIGLIVAVVLSVIMIVIGGIQYMGSDSFFSKGEAKEKWTNVAWGLLLVLGIYLFLYTINPNLVELKLNLGKGESGGPGVQSTTGTPSTPSQTTPATPSSLGRWTEKLAQSVVSGDQMVRKQISDGSGGKVRVKENICNMDLYKQWVSNGNANGGANCTTVGNLGVRATRGLILLSKSSFGCNCSFLVTGGTEWGHSSHFPSQNMVDIAWGSGVDAFVQKNSSSNAPAPFVRVYKGVLVGDYRADFYEEDAGGKHWHVVF